MSDYQTVTDATVGRNHLGEYWWLTLACGHTLPRAIDRDADRRPLPAPQAAQCPQCIRPRPGGTR